MEEAFKGIALFTPGGDIIYSIDANKGGRWHINLCTALQEVLGLSEPPHFLVPTYTATIDRWLDPKTGAYKTAAEVYPPVQRYQSLLNEIFQTPRLRWQTVPWSDKLLDPGVILSYRSQFPQLWQDHDLVIPYQSDPIKPPTSPQSYVLRLFISGHSPHTEATLVQLHKLLGRSLHSPYTLKVIDISKHPDQAEANQVTATPTLVRVFPQPLRRIVGDFHDTDRLIKLLIG